MGFKNVGKSFVRSKYDEFGVYVWVLPNGKYLMDEDANVLSISSTFGNIERICKIKSAAKMCGFPDGHAVFLPGQRKVTEEEYQRQVQRLNLGLIPDEYDLAAYEEEARAQKINGR